MTKAKPSIKSKAWWDDETTQRFTGIDRALRKIQKKLDRIENAVYYTEQQGTYLMATLDDVLAEMERDTTVSDGILAMLEKLQADIIAAGGNQAKIDAVFNGFKANTDKLAAALVVNTPPTGSTGGV